MDSSIELLKSANVKDENGVYHASYTAREVFCRVGSITRAEFFGAGRNGLNPQYVFTVFAEDYEGEDLVRYDGESYSIYRTYRTDSDYMELYAEKKGGTYGKDAD